MEAPTLSDLEIHGGVCGLCHPLGLSPRYHHGSLDLLSLPRSEWDTDIYAVHFGRWLAF